MPEYQNVKKLDRSADCHISMIFLKNLSLRFENRLPTWCNPKIRTPLGYDFLRQLFVYDPDKRLNCREALMHKWFEEDPKPTRK